MQPWHFVVVYEYEKKLKIQQQRERFDIFRTKYVKSLYNLWSLSNVTNKVLLICSKKCFSRSENNEGEENLWAVRRFSVKLKDTQ